MNFKNLLTVNFESMKNLVIGERKSGSLTVVDKHRIRRNPSTGHIITTTENKDYRIVFDKRVIHGNDYNRKQGL